MMTDHSEEPLCFAKRQAAEAQPECTESATATQTVTRVARENKDSD